MKNRSYAAKTLFIVAVAALASLAIGIPRAFAGSVPSTAEATKNEDSPITRQVQHKLMMLPWYGVFDNLQYQVKGSEVTLTGQVVSEHEVTKHDAEMAVKNIEGVTKVVNDIQVLPTSTFDDQIRHAEYRTIFRSSDLSRYSVGVIPQIHIIVDNGHVTLEGEVINRMDRSVAGVAANSVPGVFSVTNNLGVG